MKESSKRKLLKIKNKAVYLDYQLGGILDENWTKKFREIKEIALNVILEES